MQRRSRQRNLPARGSLLSGKSRSMNDKQTSKARSEQDRLLDQALEETFPASDPISTQQSIIVGRVDRQFPYDVRPVKTEKRS
jgi:hypothetical protein